MRNRPIDWGTFVVFDQYGKRVATRHCGQDAFAEVQRRVIERGTVSAASFMEVGGTICYAPKEE